VPAFREGVNFLLARTEEIQKVHAHVFEGLADAQEDCLSVVLLSVILSPESKMVSVNADAEPPCKHRHLANQSAESQEKTCFGIYMTAQFQVEEYNLARPD